VTHFDQLLEEIESIKDESIRDFTLSAVKSVSKENWTKRASANHHPEDERGLNGNTIHTLRVVRVTKCILDLLDRNQYSKDCAVSAAILHDICRYGKFGYTNYTDVNHPEIAVAFLNKIQPPCPNKDIIESVRHHMSQWGPSCYKPELLNTDIVILADYIASQDDILVKVDKNDES
jgi:hypothetical protein